MCGEAGNSLENVRGSEYGRGAALKGEACHVADGLSSRSSRSTQTIAQLPDLLMDICDEARRVIVVAVDGVGFDVAREVWSPDLMVALRTTFPSTSSSAWLSAVTGCGVEKHLVPGVRYRVGDRLVDCFDDGPWPQDDRPADLTTVFERLAQRGTRSLVIPGEVSTWGIAWIDALFRGARVLESDVNWERMRFAPRAQARVVLARLREAVDQAVDEAVDAQADDARLLIWCWIDVDDHVHRHGYVREVLGALADLGAAARTLADNGYIVVALSDHGLVPTRCPPRMREQWRDANSSALCRLPPGGAGRTRWCYPRPGREAEVLDRVGDALGDDAIVVERDQLTDLGLMEVSEGIQVRIGEVVAIATDSRFPTPDPTARYEHGGITPTEMTVPLATWRPA
jgi:hypothetical protein